MKEQGNTHPSFNACFVMCVLVLNEKSGQCHWRQNNRVPGNAKSPILLSAGMELFDEGQHSL
jgi:hypothetical protein